MVVALIQYTLNNDVYKILHFMCTKSGYKTESLNKEAGTIVANKRTIFMGKITLKIKAISLETSTTKIEISTIRKNLPYIKEEQKIIDSIYKYF